MQTCILTCWDMLINLQPPIWEVLCQSAVPLRTASSVFTFIKSRANDSKLLQNVSIYLYTHHRVSIVTKHSAVARDTGLPELINPVHHNLPSKKKIWKSAVHVLFFKCITKQMLLCHILRYDVTIYNVKYIRIMTKIVFYKQLHQAFFY